MMACSHQCLTMDLGAAFLARNAPLASELFGRVGTTVTQPARNVHQKLTSPNPARIVGPVQDAHLDITLRNIAMVTKTGIARFARKDITRGIGTLCLVGDVNVANQRKMW